MFPRLHVAKPTSTPAERPPVALDDRRRWMTLMRRGRFAEAWDVNDRVWRSPPPPLDTTPRHDQRIWSGAPLRGRRVLIRCYHGLGDTLQFIRYAGLVREVARETTVWTPPALLALLGRQPHLADRWLPLDEGAGPSDYDVDVESMELPYVFRTTLDTLPSRVPYVRVDPAPPLTATRLHVGVVWRAGDWDRRRSVPFDTLGPLWRLRRIVWHPLQLDRAADEWRPQFRPPAGCDRIGALARLIRRLDLVISVDTMAAHLAGALGARAWILLPDPADWRWMVGRDDSPWYPTLRLFRQTRPGDWSGVIERVADELTRVRRMR